MHRYRIVDDLARRATNLDVVYQNGASETIKTWSWFRFGRQGAFEAAAAARTKIRQAEASDAQTKQTKQTTPEKADTQ
jgi:hypothetical protein